MHPDKPTPIEALPLFAAAADTRAPIFLTNPSTRLEKSFARFHRANPGIYRALERRALELAEQRSEARRSYIGVKQIIEDLRYDPAVETDGKPFAISNSHTAFYARLLVARHRWLEQMIRLRPQKHVRKAE